MSQAQVLGIRASESYFGRSAADEEGCKKERPLERIWQSPSENISAFIKWIINGSRVLHNSGFTKANPVAARLVKLFFKNLWVTNNRLIRRPVR